MESELLPDCEKKLSPVLKKEYEWEDLRRDRDAGGYPWTHLLKVPLEGEITAEDIIRETTPRRSMSRELTKSRTHSPVDRDEQKILNLDSSPGSSRRHGEEGEDEGVHIPNFSKEVSLDSDDSILNKTGSTDAPKSSEGAVSIAHLSTPAENPKSISPKSILKRRTPEPQYIGVSETREKTKCCHPLVNKIKHLADKTLHKLDKSETDKSPLSKRKKNEKSQEIRQLKNSPGAIRRQKFSAIKLGDSDEMSKTMSNDTPPPRKKKEHIYEDIDESKDDLENVLQLPSDLQKHSEKKIGIIENDNIIENKSIASQDPSLVIEDNLSLKADDHIMEKLYKKDDINKEALLLDEEMDPDEPNVEEVFQNQKDDSRKCDDSPNITITEIVDDDNSFELSTTIPIETSPSPSPRDTERKQKDAESIEKEWSRPNSDHEYEIIEKPPPNIIYTAPSKDEKPAMVKTEDELSSTASLERKYLQHTSDEEDHVDNDKTNKEQDENFINTEELQKDIEERFFVNTPSSASRTECEISTSQVEDSSALENLPLKRSSRNKNSDVSENKIQQRIKEGTGKLKSQAGKLKAKLHNIKTKQFSLPERPKFKMPERPKISLPDRRKFSLPERPKFKKINISEKLSFGDRKKFSFPDRPKFVSEFPKLKMPERPKISFPSIGRKKDQKTESNMSESTSNLQNVATVEFEAKTYPRLFNRRKKTSLTKTSSSPILNREDTPPPTFTFTRMKKSNQEEPTVYTPDTPEQPREYGIVDHDVNYGAEVEGRKQFSTTYDFDKLDQEYADDEENQENLNDENTNSIPDTTPSNQEYTHINELNNDEFFVRPRGISRENIQVREYLSDEIRQAFNIPKNVLAAMGTSPGIKNIYANELETDVDPELMIDDSEPMRYSTEDINERDDGYYTFPPVRPSRAKRKKKDTESIKFIDDSVNASMQFSEVDLGLSEDQIDDIQINIVERQIDFNGSANEFDIRPTTDLQSIHEYANDDVIEYPDGLTVQSKTLPMPPKRKKKPIKRDYKHSSLNDFNSFSIPEMWQSSKDQSEDIIVYRTQHEYVVPQSDVPAQEQSPLVPRRNRSRSSRTASVCDDDRTSHGAESLILDPHLPTNEDVKLAVSIRQDSPGYATVDKSYISGKTSRRSKSKTPPARRKSNSSERKYYTVSGTKSALPSRPPRKKSSTSLMTLNSFRKDSFSGDATQYDEIDVPQFEEVQKDLQSGAVVSKMKDRPLPPPPRPPRGPKRQKFDDPMEYKSKSETELQMAPTFSADKTEELDIVEIEVSTQTDPLPDDLDFELGIDENLDVSMTSSLRDIIDEESILGKAYDKPVQPRRPSRSVSRSEKSLKLSDPKISDYSKQTLGRTSPAVILVEKRVSSPTKINERNEILTEASLTVKHIDIDESQIPDVPPLPRSVLKSTPAPELSNVVTTEDDRALKRVSDPCRDVQLDNLITQRLHVKDLDVGRLNVSELQATKILVSDIEGMTLNVNELDSKSGHISVSGIEFSQSVIDEIVKKFAEISTSTIARSQPSVHTIETMEIPRPVSREEETQTESQDETNASPSVIPKPETIEDITVPPQRPPPPDLTPLLYSYLRDMAMPSTSLQQTRSIRERQLGEFHEPLPTPPTRRSKRKPTVPQSESSSDENKPRPSPRRMPQQVRAQEPSITEAGTQFLRVCQNSISRTFRNIFNTFMSYISKTEDKRDIQMAMVILLVLIAGLIMFGLSDSRTIHHHHWEFFNPPDNKQ